MYKPREVLSISVFLRERSKVMVKRRFWVLLAVFGISAGLFTGCNTSLQDDNSTLLMYYLNPKPLALNGTWLSTFDETYIISDTKFISEYFGAVSYAGNIVNIRALSSNSGYITIRYTECYEWISGVQYPVDTSSDIFYVIHYKNLTFSSVDLAGAGSNTDPDFGNGTTEFKPGGKSLQADAESTYTVGNGYFGTYSICART